MNSPKNLFRCFMAMAALIAAPSWQAVTVGQVDTFEDGTTQGWLVGLLGAPHPSPPVNVPTGGPGGIGDNYMLLTAIGGSGPGNRLTVINPLQWAGNYPVEGIGFIQMDVNNLGSSDLALRLSFSDPQGGPPANLAISSQPLLVPASSGWTTISFPIDLMDLSGIFGTVDDALANTTELRLFHSTIAGFPGESVVAQLGIDNIRAMPASLPDASSSALLLLLALPGLGLYARRVQA